MSLYTSFCSSSYFIPLTSDVMCNKQKQLRNMWTPQPIFVLLLTVFSSFKSPCWDLPPPGVHYMSCHKFYFNSFMQETVEGHECQHKYMIKYLIKCVI